MNFRFAFVFRISLLVILLMGSLFQPQSPVYAASSLTIIPITWNVVGLDSNNVNAGPNNFPVGVRACNPAGSTTSVNGVSATFTWTTTNANINLRSGSLNPINSGINLAPGQCYDFYFEVSITQTTAAWNTVRQYRIDVAGTDSGTGTPVTGSTPVGYEIYVEKLVSQNRNFVRDIRLDGVSIAAGGSMNLLVGSTYTIQLVGATATNGYEQLESFINFPNTIFKVNSVTASYTAVPTPHTDPLWASKLYANGCAWNNDPTSPNYRSCSGTGKYGGDITITYNVTIIGGGGTSQTLNTLIYDFSGSSYHYNSDFSTTYRVAIITDPSSCIQVPIAAWNFENPNGTSVTASTDNAVGTPTVTPAGLSTPGTIAGNGGGSAREHTSWNTTGILNTATDYLQFAASTEGYYNIKFSYDLYRSNQGPSRIVAAYDTDGTGTPTTISPDILAATTWTSFTKDLSAVPSMDNNSGARFLLYGYNANNASGTLRTDNFSITGCKLPAGLNIAKVGDPANFNSSGQTITYTYTLTNSGQVALQAPYTITDSKGAAMTISCTGATSPLAPGASTTCTGTYTTTSGDVAAGLVTNTASASATTVLGDPVTSNTATETVEYAALNILKDVSTSASGPWSDSVTVNVGAPVYFQMTVDNTGSSDLTGVTVDDGMAGCTLSGPTGDTDTDNILDATETWLYTCSVTAVAGTNTNTATADTNETLPDTDTASYLAAAPALTIVKLALPGVYASLDELITYTYEVTNSSNVPLDGPFVVADDKATDEACPATATLAPGASITCTASYRITQADLDSGSVTNIASASGSYNGTPVISPTDTETVTAIQNPLIVIVKSVTETSYATVGSVLHYSYEVINRGNVTLSGPFTVTDDKAADETCPATTTLTPGASITCTATYTVTQADLDSGSVTNIASSHGFFGGNAVNSTTDTETVTATQNPGMTIVKTASPATYSAVGAVINYSYLVTNSGTVTLTGPITVADDKATNEDCPTVTTFAPGASITCTASYTITQSDLDAGSVTNVASASGSFNGTPVTSPTDTETVTASQNPALAIVKTASPSTYGTVGSVINYTYQVTNSGNVALSGPFTVADDKATDEACPATATLAPGASITCTASYSITQADLDAGSVTNIASATGAYNGTPVTSPTDTETVNASASPALTIVKTASPSTYSTVGSVINYSYQVTNNGTVTLSGPFTVADDKAADEACPATATLAPGASITCTATYTATQADLDAGSVTNIASATGSFNGTPVTSPTDTETVTASQNPALTIVKAASPATYGSVGAVINYSYQVTNSGNVTLSGPFTVTDDKAADESCPATATLAPGASINCTATYTITLADLDSGSVTNIAGSHGFFGNNAVNSPTDTETVNASQNPALTIAKAADPTTYSTVGAVIGYTYTVTNSGNVSLEGPFVVTDDKAADEACPATATLAPGASITCTASYSTTQADLDTGSVTNVASASGSFSGNQITSPEDTVTVNAVQTRGINIEKTPASQTVATGGTATFTLTVTNTGNVTLTGINVTDNMCTSGPTRTGGDTNGDDQLQTTETWTYSCSVANVTEDFTNTADVSTAEEVTDSATATVTVAAAPALNIVKEVSNASNGPWNDTSVTVTAGTTVFYRVRVANTGNTTLTGLTVDDGMQACTLVRAADITGNHDNAFEVGEEWAYTCSVTAVLGTNNNTATADTNETSPDSDTASYIGTAASVADPAISKAGNPTQAAVGETVTFTLTVTNNGNTPAPNVVITDALPAMFDVTAVNVTGAPLGTLVSVTPLIGTGLAPYTVVVTLGGDLGVTDIVTITIVTTVNSLGNPPINNTATLTTSSQTDVTANNTASIAITTQTTTRPQRTVLPATGYAQNAVTFLPEQPAAFAYASTDLVVEIPSLGIKIPIVGVPKRNGTWNVSWLGDQAGWLEGSAFPSWNGNSVLTGHVYLSNGQPGPFVNLHKLKYGDKMIIHAYGQRYTFAVQTNKIVEPTDSSAMKHEVKPWLTLVTCKEYDEKTNTYKKRVIVRATLVAVEWE